MTWTFSLPTKVTFGEGCARELADVATRYGRKPILVTDAGLASLPVFTGIVRSLPEAPVFSEVEPNPTTANVDRLAALARDGGYDLLVTVGGGSALDCAKAAALLAASQERSIRAFHSEGKKPDGRHYPVIAVPTTAGTGSEVTPFAVLNDVEKNIKGPMAHDSLYPVHALVDPQLTHSMPRSVTAATGLDALCHAIEGFWSKNHQPICDRLALEAARLIFDNLGRVLVNPA